MPQETVESRALAIREEHAGAIAIGESRPLKYSLPELKQIGEMMFASGMFRDLKSVPQAMVKILAGGELGYGPFHSLTAFHVIEGKPVETSGEITARIKRSGKYRLESYFIDKNGEHLDPVKTKATETNGCVVVIHERLDGTWFALEPVVFTKEDAATAGLLGKDVWKKYLRNMLFARALTNAARFHCADIFGGPIYTPDELGAEVTIDSEGFESLVPPPQAREAQTIEQAPAPHVPIDADTPEARAAGIKAVHTLARKHGVDLDSPTSPYRKILIEHFDIFCDPEVEVSSKALSAPELRELYRLVTEHIRERDKAGAA
jgi:hypothetical protein